MELPKLIQKFKVVVNECKKAKYCSYCNAPVGKLKKMAGQPTKIVYFEPRDPDYEDIAIGSRNRVGQNYHLHADLDDQKKASKELLDEMEKSIQVELTPLRAYNVLKNIRKEDVPFFLMDANIQRPEELIVTHLIAPPVCIRPTVKVGGDRTNEDDMTVKLYEILKQNQYLQHCILEGKEMPKIQEAWTLLQNIYSQYINSETSGLPKELIGKNSTRGVCQRLKGKMGRFRGNLSGKRVEFSARTVITPDPNLCIDQVVVPKQMAEILTYGEVVSERNYMRLKEAVKNGPDKYPGANYLTLKGEKSNISLGFQRNRKIAESQKYGDIVHRHLIDDDIVLFNRQPSLHKLSIMGFRAKVMPWRTLRFNECNCTPFNADFDGDEMNIHQPQTEQAKAEVLYLMGSLENIISPKNGEPIITLTQDFITSSFVLTNKDTFMDRGEFCKVMSYITDANEYVELPPPAIIKPIELWTGKQVVSTLIAPNSQVKPVVNIELKEKNYLPSENKKHFDRNDGYVCFYNSELICGNIGKSTLGGSKTGLQYALIKDNSRYMAAACMLRFAKLSSRWLTEMGMTLGLTDVMPNQTLVDQKNDLIKSQFKACDNLIAQYHANKQPCKPGMNSEKTLETDLSKILNDIREDAGKNCLKNLHVKNSALIMAVCGSKGSNLNLCQMITCVGQQIVSGSRIADGFSRRSMPHFELDSKIPEARGFVKNSFYDGLDATEFFFHTMAGREGLIDTAVKTADTGYMQRRLIKALEDVVIHYDTSVRNSEGCIIQFLYGDDGLDPINIETDKHPINLDRLIKYTKSFYPFKYGEENTLTPQRAKEIIDERIANLLRMEGVKVITKFIDGLREYMYGLIAEINEVLRDQIEPLIAEENENAMNEEGKGEPENLVDGQEVLNIKRRKLKKARTTNHQSNDGNTGEQTKNKKKTEQDPRRQKMLSSLYILTERQLNFFFVKLEAKLQKAKSVPGDGVGAITAQSIGEPCTQMTLKTFHFAGVASMNVTLGVPRIKEIINAAKKIQTPIIEIKLLDETDEVRARMVKNRINVIRLKDVAKSIKEIYEPGGCYLEIRLDLATIRNRFLNINSEKVKEAIINSKLRLKSKNINNDECKIRIEPYDTSEREMIFILSSLKKKLGNVIVGGIPTINRAILNSKDEKDAEGNEVKNYGIYAEGQGLIDVLAIGGVNYKTTKTNHIMEILDVLGIEAARSVIIGQIIYTIEQYAINIDIRHINVLADVMTTKGRINGITRYGIAKMRDSTLMLASFEKTADVLFDAAFFCKQDYVRGVSEKIILGDMMDIGTGHFDLLYHQKKGQTDIVKDTLLNKKSILTL